MSIELKGKNVVVAGLGKSGLAVLKTLRENGAHVAVYDKKNEADINPDILKALQENHIKRFLGEEPTPSDIFDLLVVSPGIPLDEAIVKRAEQIGAVVMGELELAYALSKGQYIAITGTNGKTTTTTLLGEIFKSAGKDALVVGNIGTPAISFAKESRDSTVFIAEVSSFQLETIHRFHPHISVLLNVTPDHLNRHKTMQGYIDAKARIFENQKESDYFVVNRDCPIAYELAAKARAKVVPFSRKEILPYGCFVQDNRIVIKGEEPKLIDVCHVDEIKMPGLHNLENALAAAAAAYFGGVSPLVIARYLKNFEGVEHRIEFVRSVNGVRYINDSKGTNTDASGKAIAAMKENIILIAGGYDKEEDFKAWIQGFEGSVKHMLVMGVTSQKIKCAADEVGFSDYTLVTDMAQCIQVAQKIAQPGDTVLLSPACASWGMYQNYEERGMDFKERVWMLEGVK